VAHIVFPSALFVANQVALLARRSATALGVMAASACLRAPPANLSNFFNTHDGLQQLITAIDNEKTVTTLDDTMSVFWNKITFFFRTAPDGGRLYAR
jgi:hypothetical protein